MKSVSQNYLDVLNDLVRHTRPEGGGAWGHLPLTVVTLFQRVDQIKP